MLCLVLGVLISQRRRQAVNENKEASKSQSVLFGVKEVRARGHLMLEVGEGSARRRVPGGGDPHKSSSCSLVPRTPL